MDISNPIPNAGTRDPVQPYKSPRLEKFDVPFWGRPVYTGNDGKLYCPGYEGNTYFNDSNAWNSIKFGGPLANPFSPGIADVSVYKRRDIDKKKAAGNDGARITVHGIEPASVEIRLTIWTPDQLRALMELWPILFPPAYKSALTDAKGKPILDKKTKDQLYKTTVAMQILDAYHPMLAIHSVTSLVFVGGEGPSPGSVVNARVFTIHALEAMPLRPNVVASHTPTAPLGSINDAPVNKLPGSNPNNTGPTGGPNGT